MSFAQDTGYLPNTIAELMALVREGINEQFSTDYDEETFLGTNFYKYFYALIQRLQENEVKTSEIVLNLQQYFETTNEEIVRPNTTHPGVRDYLEEAGYVASTKAPLEADAGKLYVCVDVDDGDHASGIVTITSYANLVSGTDDSVTVGATVFTAQVGAVTLGQTTFQAASSNSATAISLAAQINGHATAGALVKARAAGAVVTIRAIHGGVAGNSIALGYTDNDTNVGATKSGTALAGGTASDTYAAEKLAIATILKDSVVAGVTTMGTETETITLSNDQSFDWSFYLPDPIPITLRLTLVTSSNNQSVILTTAETTALLLANITERYRLGLNFEPQRYFSVVDAPWCASALLEYSLDGSTWISTVATLAFNELYTFDSEDISIVET